MKNPRRPSWPLIQWFFSEKTIPYFEVGIYFINNSKVDYFPYGRLDLQT